jgi:hypothetical protein
MRKGSFEMSDSPPRHGPPVGAAAASTAAQRDGSRPPAAAADRAENRQDADGPPMIVARGLGGRLELYPDRLRIIKDGYLNYFLGLIARRPALVETTIAIEHIAAFDIVHPILYNDFLYVAYPGSPPLTGHALHDSTAENALLMNFFDNRMFYAIKRQIDAMIARPIYVTVRGNNPARPAPTAAEAGRSLDGEQP